MRTVIKDLPLNEQMNPTDMAAIEGGFSFPKNVAPIKLIAPPQPVTQPNSGGPASGGSGSFYNVDPYGEEDLHQS